MKKTIYIITLLFIIALPSSLLAQVGIGNLNPDTTTVLDLTNTESKGLMLPTATGFSQLSPSDRMMYFLDNELFLKRSDGYISLSPWKFKFNGNTSNDLYYNLGGYVGIGSSDITITPEAPLHIETVDVVSLTDNGALIIGKSNSTNIAFNESEIQSRNIASPSELKINEDGGDISFGTNATRNDVKVKGDLKELHHPTNEYYDLVPAGMIIMWHGDTLDIPIGWALCNGQLYRRANDNGDIQSPDLRGKFVVASGNNGSTNYSPNDQGGQDSVTLVAAELPSHNHSVRDAGHSHEYSWSETPNQSGVGYNKACAGKGKLRGCTPDPNKTEVTSSGRTGYTSAAVSPMTEDNVGGGGAHGNRPSYYTIVYIIKL